MGNGDFYGEQKWCDRCKQYTRYLMSVNHSYCVTCGSKVRLFSREDSRRFNENVKRHKWRAS